MFWKTSSALCGLVVDGKVSHFVWLIVNSLRLIIRAKDEEWCLYELHSFNSSHLVQ